MSLITVLDISDPDTITILYFLLTVAGSSKIIVKNNPQYLLGFKTLNMLTLASTHVIFPKCYNIMLCECLSMHVPYNYY